MAQRNGTTHHVGAHAPGMPYYVYKGDFTDDHPSHYANDDYPVAENNPVFGLTGSPFRWGLSGDQGNMSPLDNYAVPFINGPQTGGVGIDPLTVNMYLADAYGS